MGGMDVKVAVCSGLSNVAKLLDAIKAGEKSYHFIEIMCCPGGCINGGGQPHQPASVRNFVDVKGLRSKAIYEADSNKPLRKSHQNPAIKQAYDEYFENPGSHKAHSVLHTSYVARKKY
jgi:NADP-reducing hydrogenase subunit HndD